MPPPKQHEYLDQASKLFRRSLELRRAMSHRAGEADSMCSLGMVQLQMGGAGAAEGHALMVKSLELHKELRNKMGEARCRKALGNVSVHRGSGGPDAKESYAPRRGC